MCTDKVRYRDEIAAMMAITNIGEHGRDTGKSPVRPYRCPHCKGWHLTSRATTRRSRRRPAPPR